MSSPIGDPYSSVNLLAAVLLKRGYTQHELSPKPRRLVQFVAPDGREWQTRVSMPSYPFISHTAKLVSDDKRLAYDFVTSYNVRAPRTFYYPEGTTEQMASFLEAYAPLAVKPIDSSGSQGLSLDIRTLSDLKRAIRVAQQYSEKVLVQEQIQGSDVRITVLNGQVVSAILRQTPRVVGDGTSSISQLIEQENIARQSLQFEYLKYRYLNDSLISSHYLTNQTVPSDGEVVELSKTVLVTKGASLYNITDDLHDSYKATALQLAHALNPSFMVVDLMVQDYSQPQTNNNYVFMEFNAGPALAVYYATRNRITYDMVKALANMIDQHGETGQASVLPRFSLEPA